MPTLNIEEISSSWSNDSIIDRTRLGEEALKSIILHAKYLELMMQCRQKLIKLRTSLELFRSQKIRYYQGTMTKEELDQLQWVQYQGLKPLKSEMLFVLSGDEDIINMTAKVQYYEALLAQLESIMVAVKNRDWAIRNFIEYEKHLSGA